MQKIAGLIILLFCVFPFGVHAQNKNNQSLFPELKSHTEVSSSVSARTVIKFLTSLNVKDVETGLQKVNLVNWDDIAVYVTSLIMSENKNISRIALKLALEHKEQSASFFLKRIAVIGSTIEERVEAIENIAMLGNPNDIAFLHNLLSVENVKIRIAVINALGEFKSPSSVNALLPVLADSREKVKSAVINALGKIGGKQVIIPVISKLSDISDKVKITAIDVLTGLNAKQAVFSLKRLLRTGRPKVQLKILKTLHLWKLDKSADIQKIILNILMSSYKSGFKTSDKLTVLSYLDPHLNYKVLNLLLRLTHFYKLSQVLLDMASNVFYFDDSDKLATLVLSPLASSKERLFLFNLMSNSNGTVLTETALKLLKYRIDNKLNIFSVLQVLYKNSSAEAVNLISNIFTTAPLHVKIFIVQMFIRNKDDRLSSFFIKSVKTTPELRELLFDYALQTESLEMQTLLIKMVKEKLDSGYDKNYLFTQLTGYPYEKMFVFLASIGNMLSASSVLHWAKLMLHRISPAVVNTLSSVKDSSNKEFVNTRNFLYASAFIKNIKLPSSVLKIKISPKSSFSELILWSVIHHNKQNNISTKLPSRKILYLLEGLSKNNPPQNWSELLDLNIPEITVELMRFNLPSSVRVKVLLKSDNLAAKINASSNPLNISLPDWYMLYSTRKNKYVKFNMLLNFKNKSLIPSTINAFRKNFDNKIQWSVFLSFLPDKQKRKFAALWHLTPAKLSGNNQIIRFIFSSVEKSSGKYVISELPSGGFRAFSFSNRKELVIPYLPKGSVFLHFGK